MSEHFPGRWWAREADGRLKCELCPRECRLHSGQRGFCYVRQATDDGIALTTYGRSSGFCIDPIEKKPLNHFLPGSSVLSFGTAGCNLGCKFCQNHDISKARDHDRLQSTASPEGIAEAARTRGCVSVAFTYNDPVIFAEYAIDTAIACRERGIHPVAVTAGYVHERARAEFFAAMDATNVDLKGFTDRFYEKICAGRLEPVKETLAYVARETDCWLEVTTLLIPGENDGDDELDRLTSWFASAVGVDVPLHFSAFHPDYKMTDKPWTTAAATSRARDIARKNGLRHVYTGNIRDPAGQSTYCPGCGAVVIARDGYQIGRFAVHDGACAGCGTPIAGIFAEQPGTWGPRRQPVAIGP